MAFIQQPRQPTDGAINVSSHVPGRVVVSVVDNGNEYSIRMSEHNASRVLSGLALLLGIRINAQDAKAIKL